jgi:hypothetical protein
MHLPNRGRWQVAIMYRPVCSFTVNQLDSVDRYSSELKLGLIKLSLIGLSSQPRVLICQPEKSE